MNDREMRLQFIFSKVYIATWIRAICPIFLILLLLIYFILPFDTEHISNIPLIFLLSIRYFDNVLILYHQILIIEVPLNI